MSIPNLLFSSIQCLSIEEIVKMITNNDLKQELTSGNFSKTTNMKEKLKILFTEMKKFNDPDFKKRLVESLTHVSDNLMQAKKLIEDDNFENDNEEEDVSEESSSPIRVRTTSTRKDYLNYLKKEISVDIQETKCEIEKHMESVRLSLLSMTEHTNNVTNFFSKMNSTITNLDDELRIEIRPLIELLAQNNEITSEIARNLKSFRDDYGQPPIVLPNILSFQYDGQSHGWTNQINEVKKSESGLFSFPQIILPPNMGGWLIGVYIFVNQQYAYLGSYLSNNDEFNKDCPAQIQLRVKLKLMSEEKENLLDWVTITLKKGNNIYLLFMNDYNSSNDLVTLMDGDVFKNEFIGSRLSAEICFNKL